MWCVVTRQGARAFAATVEAVEGAIERRGLILFARIDHAAGAREVGLELPDELVLVFGNARAGTPLMQSDPRIGIELPLRILVWVGADGVMLGYHDPRGLSAGYDVADRSATLEQMATLLSAIVEEAAG